MGSNKSLRHILCFGDSNTHGTLPMKNLGDSQRLGVDERWPGVFAKALGGDWHIIEEGLPGRTTVHDDPIEGAHKNGLTGLSNAFESHRPLDLVIIMLGTNDLKSRFSVSALDIGLAVEKLVMNVRASAAQTGSAAPGILLIAPPPILETGILAEMFAGGAEKSAQLALQIGAVARRQDCSFVDAGYHIRSSPIDGIHFGPAEHLKLGEAIAASVNADTMVPAQR